MFPLHIGSPDDFAAVRKFLTGAGFTADTLCEALGVSGLHEVLSGKGRLEDAAAAGRLGVLARLFVLGESVPREDWTAAVPDDASDAMGRLGLVEADPASPERLISPVMLAPHGELAFASDRYCAPGGGPYQAPDDAVYPAVTKATGEFLRLLPQTPCQRLLDLCSGTGVAAITAACGGVAEQAWAADILARAAHFARFNARLNGAENVTVVQGDLYEPVGALQFDRIVAHPPYVPALRSKWTFRDAGEAGEAISHGVVAGCPRALAPGGRLYCLTTGLDLAGKGFEQRAREWLGEEAEAFDVLLVEIDSFAPQALASSLALRGQRTPEEARRLLEGFEQAGVRAFCHGLLVVQKKSDALRPAFLHRARSGPRTGPLEIDWLMDWLARSAEPGFERALLEARYRASPHCRMALEHRFEDDGPVVTGIAVRADYPFRVESNIQPWTAQALAACGRPKTGRQIYDFCRREGLIQESIGPAEFTALLRSLVTAGFLEMESLRTPAAAE